MWIREATEIFFIQCICVGHFLYSTFNCCFALKNCLWITCDLQWRFRLSFSRVFIPSAVNAVVRCHSCSCFVCDRNFFCLLYKLIIESRVKWEWKRKGKKVIWSQWTLDNRIDQIEKGKPKRACLLVVNGISCFVFSSSSSFLCLTFSIQFFLHSFLSHLSLWFISIVM